MPAFALPLTPGDLTFTWDDVIGIAPELSVLTPHQQTICINTVGSEVTVAVWGTQELVDRAGLWYAAHLGTGFRLGRASPALTEVRVGAVSKSFKQRADRAWPLEQTQYGLEYLRLINLWLPRFGLGG